MAFTLKFDNVNMRDSSFANGIRVPDGDAKIELNGGTYINVQMLNNAEITDACQLIDEKVPQMSAEEYASYQALVQAQKDSRKRKKGLQTHLLSFAEGVAASIVAAMLIR